jgi:hypothetical protein
MCATSIRAFEVHIRSDTFDILRMSACSAKASLTALLSAAFFLATFSGSPIKRDLSARRCDDWRQRAERSRLAMAFRQ